MTGEQAIEIVSYKLGLKKGEDAKQDAFLNSATIGQAISDQQQGSARKIDLKAYMQATKVLKQIKLDAFEEDNAIFLKKNGLRSEVITTSSGLQYEVIKQGSGNRASLEDTVKVNYRGYLIDGTEFDSSFSRNTSATFAVKKMIQGWQEGLQLMMPSSHYKFFIPQALGYGERGNDSVVPPFATLIFEVELLSITPLT